MKLLMVAGAFVAFTLVCVIGYLANRDIGNILFDASVACLAAAFLCRWLHQTFVRNVNASFEAHRHARNAEAAQAAILAEAQHTGQPASGKGAASGSKG